MYVCLCKWHGVSEWHVSPWQVDPSRPSRFLALLATPSPPFYAENVSRMHACTRVACTNADFDEIALSSLLLHSGHDSSRAGLCWLSRGWRHAAACTWRRREAAKRTRRPSDLAASDSEVSAANSDAIAGVAATSHPLVHLGICEQSLMPIDSAR